MKVRAALLALLLVDLAAAATWYAGRFGPLRPDAFRLFVVWALPGLVFLCGRLVFAERHRRRAPALSHLPPLAAVPQPRLPAGTMPAAPSLPAGQPFQPAQPVQPSPGPLRPGVARLLAWVAVAIAVDLSPIAIGARLGWLTFQDGDTRLLAALPRTALWALPLLVLVAIRFSEGTLRGRLFRGAGREWGPRFAWPLTVFCGTALALPAIAPGFSLRQPAFVAAALVTALAREIGSTMLYRASGLLAAGAFRGALAFIDVYLLADSLAPVVPATIYLTSTDTFYLLRSAAPLIAALLLVRALETRQAGAPPRPPAPASTST